MQMAIGLLLQPTHHGKHRKFSVCLEIEWMEIHFSIYFFSDSFGNGHRLCSDTAQLISTGTFRRELKAATIAFDTLALHVTYSAVFMNTRAHRNRLPFE